MRFRSLGALSVLLLFLQLPGPSSEYELSINHEEVTDSDRRVLLEIAKAVKRVKRNPFKRDEGRSSVDSDLRQKEDNGDDNGGDEESEGKPENFQGSANDYCDKFEQHFSYFCVGETDQTDKNAYVIKKFCPSYKTACKHKAVTTSVSLTSWPTDPFAKEITVASRPLPSTSGRTSHSRRRDSDEDSDSAEDEEVYYAELRKRYPCKPDCDKRIFAHCTEECKCDYIYPVVQRFCNPPPMPMFLNTCRLWYHGCPKYERYHYASQFVYSKAEKGKVLPGSPDQASVNPYGLPQPAPLRNRALALAPIRRQKRDAENEDLVVPPPVPSEIQEREASLTAPESRAILQNYRENLKSGEKKKRRSRRKKLRRRRRHRQRFSFDKDFEEITTTKRPPTPRELWRALKQLNSLTSGPGAVGLKSSPATLKGGGEAQGGLDGLLASVTQPQRERDEAARQWATVEPTKETSQSFHQTPRSPHKAVETTPSVLSTDSPIPEDSSTPRGADRHSPNLVSGSPIQQIHILEIPQTNTGIIPSPSESTGSMVSFNGEVIGLYLPPEQEALLE
ncbi:uncharacterized protein CELE_T05D4.4 [Caenorhabditis elegans]|uniref:Uncharacterized protein n=1 Tax=Caenorhabditis elegans TaxID=6239 RepID=C8JQS1_CAEEL|nr:Uncharacterized protein CELE_T05D4.4 [Caenorhabditis elegans]CBB16233.1 Uncharacterized protein CELE_T05D4.4 [Caenorhabditis elegans]|eukprot:NP_001255210.1 Uncharacterized protein CELE_T05D4.4 [Caenorhabditis elegans]